jgi:hypothetical protein
MSLLWTGRLESPSMSTRLGRISLLFTLAIVAFVGWLSERENRAPFAEDAELRRGSAVRQRIDRILEGHRIVRERLLAELRLLGVEPAIERDFACSPRGACAWVENIVATRKGRTALAPLLVASHYDSVPAGPGAGDAMTAVAAMMQTIEELRGVELARDIIFLIDDGEERGLLGAVAHAKRHPAKEYLAVLNFEARGTSGPLLMFETTQPDGPLAEIYARGSQSPATGSLFASIYERLPNDTDLTAFRDRGFRGLNFAFIGSVEHYHTPLDAPRSLEPHAVARYASEMKDTVVRFANHSKALDDGARATFFDLFHQVAFVWPSWLDPILAALLLAGVIALLRSFDAGRPSLRALLQSVAMTLAAIIIPILAALPISPLLHRGSDWLVDARPALLSTVLLALAAVMLAARSVIWLRCNEVAVAAGMTLVLLLLAIVFRFVLPGATYVALLPAFAGVMHLAGLRARAGWLTLPLAVIANAAVLAMLIPAIEDALGLPALPVAAFLAAIILLPLITVRDGRVLTLVAIASILVAMLSVATVARHPRFDASHPAKRSILAVTDESGARYLHRIASSDLATGLREPSQWTSGKPPYEWSRDDHLEYRARPRAANLPDVIIDRTGPNRHRITIVSRRIASRAAVTFPSASRIRSIEIGGESIDPETARSGDAIRVMHHTHAIRAEPVEVVVDGEGPVEVWIEDQAFETFDELRTPLGVEYQEGDLSIALRSIVLR